MTSAFAEPRTPAQRVVITGLGVVAPGGVGVEAFWERITSGNSATRTISTFDPSGFRSQIAAEVDFDANRLGLTHRDCHRLDRTAQFALVAAREAFHDSKLAHHDPTRMGVSLGTAVGSTCRLESEFLLLSDSGRDWVLDHRYAHPNLYDYYMPGSIAAEVARDVHAQGPVATISAGCTSGIDSVGHAMNLIEEGKADVVIAGASDAPISPITVACFDAIKATSNSNDDPEHALRPFDRTRNGFVLGEGAAMLVLESLAHAQRRGAPVYAEISGYASRSNAYHMTGLLAEGEELAAAITAALIGGGIPPAELDYVCAHGTATAQNDRHETSALKKALGAKAYAVPISSIKSMVGHSLGAIGSIEIAACTLVVQRGVIPPTANLHDPDPELDLDYVPLRSRNVTVNRVLNVGSGFGGFQSAIIISRTEHGDRK